MRIYLALDNHCMLVGDSRNYWIRTECYLSLCWFEYV